MGKIICPKHGGTGIVLVSNKIFNQLVTNNMALKENIFVIQGESFLNKQMEYYADEDFIEKYKIPLDRTISFEEIELLENTEKDFIGNLKAWCNKCFFQIYERSAFKSMV